jgi:hypothetical protein
VYRELFSRRIDGILLPDEAVLTPLPIEEDISSLSAILLDNGYYEFLKSGVRIMDGLPILEATHIIPFKADSSVDLPENVRADLVAFVAANQDNADKLQRIAEAYDI